jgi:hypothetical protein
VKTPYGWRARGGNKIIIILIRRRTNIRVKTIVFPASGWRGIKPKKKKKDHG